ncbi:MAG: murein biosynthesis integral membrane protein MurJ [Chloroflexaceae bacterium]|nr:murein biosynthesis integral membrane protein MurJ [Chloroflexaceae bacterium]
MTTDDQSQARSVARSIAIAALLISLGNVASRLLGLGRQSAIAFFFGRGLEVDAYTLAWNIPNNIYELLINGAISAALVPVLSEYAEGDKEEFWRVVSGIFNIALLVLGALLALAAWQAPFLIALQVDPTQAALRPLATELLRLLLPAVFVMGLSGLMLATLYARRTFLFPAFAGAIFNLGIIIGAALFHQQLGVTALAVGALIGALGQVIIQSFGFRGLRYHATFGLDHPAVRRMLLLYGPVALGVFFSIVGTTIDRRLASQFPAAPSTMYYATTLIQFPLGLIASAVSMAVLPTLSRQSAADDRESFRRTLAMGLKVVLLLVLPAAAGLAALASPIVALLFQRGQFAATDTAATALALLFYLPGLPAAALDQVLLFAFYARKNTLLPNMVQGAAIIFYLLSALPLLFFTQLGFLALVLGNSVQWISHALILYMLMRRDTAFGGLRLGEAALKSLLASAGMAAVVYGVALGSGELPHLAQLLLAGGVGVLVYLGLAAALRVEALNFFVDALRSRLQRGKG